MSASKALLANPATHSLPACASAASAVATLYALTWRGLRQAAAAQLPDLLLLGSFWGAAPLPAAASPGDAPRGAAAAAAAQALHGAAQALLSALLAPPPAGAPAAAAGGWPPAAARELIGLVRAHRARHGGAPPSPQTLRRWRPRIAVAAAAAVPHARHAPAALLSAVACCLVDCLLRLAPSHDSCMAGELLELALLSGEWGAWRPYAGGAAPLLQRCAHRRFSTAARAPAPPC